MTHLYYTDPLAAAYMKREYGVDIQMRSHVAPYGRKDYALRSVPLWVILKYTDKDFTIGTEKYVVAQESADIFTPQDNDAGRVRLPTDGIMDGIFGNAGQFLDAVDGDWYFSDEYDLVAIYARNGKPFIMPQKEEHL